MSKFNFFKKIVKNEQRINTLAFASLLILATSIIFYGVTVRLNDYSPNTESQVSSSAQVSSETAQAFADVNEEEPKNEGDKVCYLTFDDGPSDNTLKILEVLDRYNAKATFFVIGTAKMEYLNNIKDSGNAIGIHCYDHDYKKIYSSTKAFKKDFNKANEVIEKYTGEEVKIFRFPGGSSNTVSRKYSNKIMSKLTKSMTKNGYFYFDWNADSGDAAGNNVSVKKIVKNIKSEIYTIDGNGKKKLKESVCILMHDSNSKDTTVKALPKVINYLRDKGYRFEVLTENSPEFHHSVNN